MKKTTKTMVALLFALSIFLGVAALLPNGSAFPAWMSASADDPYYSGRHAGTSPRHGGFRSEMSMSDRYVFVIDMPPSGLTFLVSPSCVWDAPLIRSCFYAAYVIFS